MRMLKSWPAAAHHIAARSGNGARTDIARTRLPATSSNFATITRKSRRIAASLLYICLLYGFIKQN
jgi:hypothetical protein